ncbi:hypothetical protein RV134_320126 [Roseovarius sp. EC-HK134]|nr:hypothetical protein RV420_380055 [Roseovarius sp. EC-SD190]VVT23373.1 hypothetical protein RV134_320126 [Roseovarius sp. EC-HK134]
MHPSKRCLDRWVLGFGSVRHVCASALVNVLVFALLALFCRSRANFALARPCGLLVFQPRPGLSGIAVNEGVGLQASCFRSPLQIQSMRGKPSN